MAAGEFGTWRHLAARFAGALSPAGPAAGAEGWALGHLGPGERALWTAMSGPDRRHAVEVARAAIALLPPDPSRAVVAAALLHDVGKVPARLGTWSRAAVTLVAMAAGRRRVAQWCATGDGLRARVGTYLSHDAVGADLLRAAGADPLTVAWATEHHMAPGRRSIDPAVAAALAAADS